MPWANRHRGEYPADWHEIALRVKKEEGWKCERCKTPHDMEKGLARKNA